MADNLNNGEDELISTLLKSHQRDEFIEVFEAAVDKWLDKKFAQVGKWTINGVMAMAIASLVYYYLTTVKK